MATLDTTAQLTLLELANRIDPQGNLAVIAEILHKSNPVLNDIPWVEANATTFHKITQRLTLPTGEWRKVNAGVGIEASETRVINETIGMLETYSEVDKAIVDMAPNPKAVRMTEAKAFIEGLSQTWATALFYSNSATDSEEPNGLAPRLDATSQDNVISAGSTSTAGDLTSIYVVQWGEDKVHGIYPRNSKTAGIEHRDLGEVTKTVFDAAGASTSKQFQAYRDHFKLNFGLAVRDNRCIARLCNIEVTGTTNIFDEDDLIALINEMPYEGAGAVIYVPSVILTQMQIKLKDKTNVYYTPGEDGYALSGKPPMYFQGIPVRKVGAIVKTESLVS